MSDVTENVNAKENGAPPHEVPDSCFYLTNVAIERVEQLVNEELSSDIADLWVRDIEDLEEGRCYPLISAGPNRWEVKGAIKLPVVVREVRCEVHCTAGHIHYITDIDCTAVGLRSTTFKEGLRKTMQADGEGEERVISWNFSMASESGTPFADDGLAAHINACSCAGCIPGLAYTPKAIEILHSALLLTPVCHPSIKRCFVKLAKQHELAFRVDRSPSHIDEAISALSRALELTPKNDSDFLTLLGNLAKIHMLRFDLTEDISDLNQAISRRRQAVEATPQGNQSLHCRYNSLGHLLQSRFDRSGDLSDLSDSIAVLTKAMALMLGTRTGLQSLAKALRCSFRSFLQQINASLRDAQAFLSAARENRMGPCNCSMANLLKNIAKLLRLRFRRVGKLPDLNASISVQRLLVRLTGEGFPNFSSILEDLGNSLQYRFQHQEEVCDIDEAIATLQKTVQLDPSRVKITGGSCITHRIAYSFLLKYNVTGNCDDLNEAVRIFQQMVYVDSDAIKHPCAAAWLGALALSFSQRFDRTGNPRDLTEAISIQEGVIQRTQDDDEAIGPRLATLSQMLGTRFEVFGDSEDINKAISFGRKAIKGALNNDNQGFLLNNLAGCLIQRIKKDDAKEALPAVLEAARRVETSPGPLDYATEAITLLQKALRLTPSEDRALPVLFNSLARCFHARFKHSGDLRDIQEAIGAQLKAIKLSPDWHAGKANFMAYLGGLFHSRYHHTGDDEDRVEMAKAYEAALASPFPIPRERLQAALQLTKHYSETPKAVAAFDAAIDATAMMVGLDQTISQRYSLIPGLSEMPLKAAAFACRLGRPDKAVEWLEQGRCLVWSQLNNLRTPLEVLRTHDPELATQIADASRRLEKAGSTRSPVDDHMSRSEKLSLDDEAHMHTKLARRWEDLLKQARSIPGFQSFLKPFTCSSLIEHLPSSGPVIIINASKTRCDAIALVAGLEEPLHIPLPNLTISNARMYRASLNKQLCALGFRTPGAEIEEFSDSEDALERAARPYKSKPLHVRSILKALWTEVVKPILEALAISKASTSSNKNVRRVWWCPTGVLSFLPLHAAGIYEDSGSECVLDYAVSSYTPSISSLLERVRDARRVNRTRSGLFLTNQPNAAGYSALPGTTKEVKTVYDIAEKRGVRVLKVEGKELSVNDCLKYMEEYSGIHLACHGLQSTKAPLKSQLRLEAGALELNTIMQKNLKDADFAFLSACQTSTGEEKLDNEVVHLAAGMLAAGYRRVVATMWNIRDRPAIEVADDFYRYLFDHREEPSGTGFDGSLSAHALHHATRELRDRLDVARKIQDCLNESWELEDRLKDLEKSLLIWIPYVHFGY